MKKTLLSVLAGLAIIGTVSAQEDSRVIGTTTNKGANILPAAGDIAIGVDAVPFLGYIGNLFTDANNNAPDFQGPNSFLGGNNTLYGKYFLTDKSAVRARLSFDFRTLNNTELVQDDVAVAADPTSDAEVTDKYTEKNNYVEIGAGYELRRGYGRLQGFYGAEAFVGFGSSSEKYSYGNAITSTNTNPSNAFGFGPQRPTSVKDGNLFLVGVGGFAGVEYFIAPKISLGGEVGASIITGRQKGQKETTEEWDAANSVVKTETDDNSKEKIGGFDFGTRANGRIMLTFHF